MRSLTTLITTIVLAAVVAPAANAKSEFAYFDEQISGHWSSGWSSAGDPTQCDDEALESIRGAGTEEGSFATKTVPVRVGGFLGGPQSIEAIPQFSAEVPAQFSVTRTLTAASNVSCHRTTDYEPEQLAPCAGTRTFKGTASADLGDVIIGGNKIHAGVGFIPILDRDVYDCPFRFAQFSPAAFDGLYTSRDLPKSVVRNAKLGKPIVLKLHKEFEETDTSVRHVITHQPSILDVTVTLTMRCHVATGQKCPKGVITH